MAPGGNSHLDPSSHRASNKRIPLQVPAMRKMLLAVASLLLMCGLAVGVEVTLLKFDKDTKEVTVKEGEVEKVYKITDATKFFGVDKSGNMREMTYDDAVKGLGNQKSEGKLKFDITANNDEITQAKMPAKPLK
jgi:hypothetical protein